MKHNPRFELTLPLFVLVLVLLLAGEAVATLLADSLLDMLRR